MLHIFKGTQSFHFAPPFVKVPFRRWTSWSFREQPGYSWHLTLYPALLSASHWELSPPQARASGPNSKDPINQWLCPGHTKHLHQWITFLTKRPHGHQTFGAKHPPSAHSSTTACLMWQWHLPRAGTGLSLLLLSLAQQFSILASQFSF